MAIPKFSIEEFAYAWFVQTKHTAYCKEGGQRWLLQLTLERPKYLIKSITFTKRTIERFSENWSTNKSTHCTPHYCNAYYPQLMIAFVLSEDWFWFPMGKVSDRSSRLLCFHFLLPQVCGLTDWWFQIQLSWSLYIFVCHSLSAPPGPWKCKKSPFLHTHTLYKRERAVELCFFQSGQNKPSPSDGGQRRRECISIFQLGVWVPSWVLYSAPSSPVFPLLAQKNLEAWASRR